MIENRLSHFAFKKRVTISQIHRDTGISRSTLTKMYYNQIRNVNLDVIERLCCYFGCQIHDMISVKEHE